VTAANKKPGGLAPAVLDETCPLGGVSGRGVVDWHLISRPDLAARDLSIAFASTFINVWSLAKLRPARPVVAIKGWP
jgi:hypothetical protein